MTTSANLLSCPCCGEQSLVGNHRLALNSTFQNIILEEKDTMTQDLIDVFVCENCGHIMLFKR